VPSTKKELGDRWETNDGKDRIERLIKAIAAGEDWGLILVGFPHVEEVPDNRDLRYIPFAGVDLRNANFINAAMDGANLHGANLRAAKLSSAQLTKAICWRAKLSEAKLTNANLSGAQLGAADLRESDLSGANLRGADIAVGILTDANLHEADLHGADLGGAVFKGANLSGAQLQGVKMGGVNLDGAQLVGADLSGADLGGSNLCRADLSGAVFRNTNLGGSDMKNIQLSDPDDPDYKAADFTDASIGGANLCNTDLRGSILKNAELGSSNLIGADLSGIDFENASLESADLSNANLHKARLNKAKLSGAKFSGTDLSGADLRGVFLVEANCGNAILRGALLSGVKLRGATLAQSDLQHAVFHDDTYGPADLQYANLRQATLRGVSLSAVDLSGADLYEATLCQANLINAELRGANLCSADLKEADLREVNLVDTKLDGATLTGTKLWETQRSGWSIKGVSCENVYWDRGGQEDTPYGKGEFERLFSDKAKIVLHYKGRNKEGISPIELATLPGLIGRLEQEGAGGQLNLKSVKSDAGGATVTIEVADAGDLNPEKIQDLIGRNEAIQALLMEEQELRISVEKRFAKFRDEALEIIMKKMANKDVSEPKVEDKSMTIMFLDSKGFTGLDDPNRRAQLQCLRDWGVLLIDNAGAGTKNMWGDAIVAAFEDPAKGLGCAYKLLQHLAIEGIKTRIGMSHGKVRIGYNPITQQRDIEGDSVNLGARLEPMANPGEVLISRPLRFHPKLKEDQFVFTSQKRWLQKALGDKPAGTEIDCFSVALQPGE